MHTSGTGELTCRARRQIKNTLELGSAAPTRTTSSVNDVLKLRVNQNCEGRDVTIDMGILMTSGNPGIQVVGALWCDIPISLWFQLAQRVMRAWTQLHTMSAGFRFQQTLLFKVMTIYEKLQGVCFLYIATSGVE